MELIVNILIGILNEHFVECPTNVILRKTDLCHKTQQYKIGHFSYINRTYCMYFFH